MFLRELFEAEGKTAVLAFGRLNPPTIGHAKLVDKITSIKGDHFLFLSQTQKPKTDPLDFATKLKFAKQFFPGVNVGHQSVRTPVQALEFLQGQGYTDIIFIAGSDRVDGFQKLFNTYNGQPDKSGNVPFKFNTIKVVSAGERDPDADDVSGMSASKMRAAAASGNLEAFAQGVPDKKLAKTMYDAVRKGMGVKDEQPVEERSTDQSIKTAISKLFNKKNYKAALAYMKKTGRSAADVARMFDNVDARELDRMATEGTNEMAAYKGNVGIMELVKFYQDAKKNGDEDLIVKVKKLIDNGEDQKVWQIVQDYTGTKLVGKQFAYESIAEMIAVETSLLETESCKHGRYYCSTDKKYKCRQGPKKSRGS